MKDNFSIEHVKYVKKIKRENWIIKASRIGLLLILLFLWESLAYLNVIDSFITSSPSKIARTIISLVNENNLFYHIGVTLYETILGFFITIILGYLIALILWSFERVRKVLEPYIVVINSLPKIALGPIIIVWCGAGTKSIIFMAVLIGIIVAIITMINGFLSVDKDKELLLKSMGAKKIQILTKLVVPATIPNLISMMKISVGMSWIGSIMGEYLVSKAGLGYLIVYGGQVFKLDLVMAATVVLCLLATLMYFSVTLLEKLIRKYT